VKRFTVSVDDDTAEVLASLAHLDGFTGRTGAWIADRMTLAAQQAATHADVVADLANRRSYQEVQAAQARTSSATGKPYRFGVIDGGQSVDNTAPE
jgi:hypothetical protein